MLKEILKLENISLIRDNFKILKNISFTINKNENWAIVGRNGSGKSFLLKIISTMIYPSFGDCFIYKKNICGMNLLDIRKHIGIVSDTLQKDYDDDFLVNEVVLCGFFASIGVWEKVNKEKQKKTDEILEKLKITFLKNRKFSTLSSGEKKLVLIARSLVFNPSILILDEPCNTLDLASKKYFLNILKKIVLNVNIVFVTHHINEIIPEIQNVILLKKGEIIKIGKKEDILTKNNISLCLDLDVNLKIKKGFYYINY